MLILKQFPLKRLLFIAGQKIKKNIDVIYQSIDTAFHHQMKHLEIRQKYSAVRRTFNSLLSVSCGDKTLCLMLNIFYQYF